MWQASVNISGLCTYYVMQLWRILLPLNNILLHNAGSILFSKFCKIIPDPQLPPPHGFRLRYKHFTFTALGPFSVYTVRGHMTTMKNYEENIKRGMRHFFEILII